MNDAPAEQCRFGCFRLDCRRRELRREDGSLVPLTAKAFDTLCQLVAHNDRVMSKDELLAAVWPGRVVEENNLSQAISALRRALGTEGGEHRYIVTLPGRGYQFVADVRTADAGGGAGGNPPGATATAGEETAVPTPPPPAPIVIRDRRARTHPDRSLVLGSLLLVLVVAAVAVWRLQQRDAAGADAGARATADPVALVVLPFRPLSASPRDELLELGMADTLVTRLGRVGALRVRSVMSTRRLAAEQDDPFAIGRELAASHVVAGTTQRVGDAVRVNVQLWSVDGGEALWAQTFDADINRVFTLQDQIGDALIAALALRPGAIPARAASPCEGDDALAYRALLRAQYQLHRRGGDTIAAFRETISRDPSCSRAYAGLAIAYMFQAHNDRRPDEVFPLARGAVQHALRLDPDSVEGHIAHGRYLQLHDWDWRGSEEALRRAIARNPSHAEARFALAHLLVSTGRFDQGLAEVRQARELDPLSPLINALEGGFLSAAGQPEAARVRLERALELEPDFWIALLVRGGLALDRGEPEAAVADLHRAAERTQRNSQVLAVLAAAEVAAGRRAQAEAILRELQASAADDYVPATSLAAVHNALGDTGAALDELERAHAAHDIRIAFLKVDARWNSVRGEPRFRALMHQLALREAPASGRY